MPIVHPNWSDRRTVRAYTDRDLMFFMHVYHNPDAADWFLSHLRQHFPQALVVLMSDGDPDPAYAQLATRYHTQYCEGERMIELRHGGGIVQRMLGHFVAAPCAYLFKVDVDTGIHRRFESLPMVEGIFGTVQTAGRLASIQGGCVGFTRCAATTLYESGLLLEPALALAPEATWAIHPSIADRVKRGLTSEDWVIGYTARALGLALYSFSEICSRWKVYTPNPLFRFAVTHPCKERML